MELMYGQIFKYKRLISAGPNISGFPARKKIPDSFIIELVCNEWIEASHYRKMLLINAGVKTDSITIIPHAVDINLFSKNNRNKNIWNNYGCEANTIKILFVATDIGKKVKAFHIAVEAFKHCQKRYPNLEFIIVGGDSNGIVNSMGNKNGIHFLGKVYGDKLATILASGDILLLTSISENCPNILLEAMASGLAVVANNVGGIPEIVDDGSTGLLVDLMEKKEKYRKDGKDILDRKFKDDAVTILSDVIFDLLSHEERREELAAKARNGIIEYYSESRLGQDLINIFTK